MPLVRKPADAPGPSVPDRDAAVAQLHDGSTEERWSAARALAGVPDAVPALREALASESERRVREAILTSLVRIGDAASVEAVLPHLHSDDAALRTETVDALKAMPETARTGLARLLRDADPDVRVLACDVAREMPAADAAHLLAELLENDPEVNVCAAALEALAEIGGPEALPAVARCAERFADRPFLGFAAQMAAGRIGARHG